MDLERDKDRGRGVVEGGIKPSSALTSRPKSRRARSLQTVQLLQLQGCQRKWGKNCLVQLAGSETSSVKQNNKEYRHRDEAYF